MLDNPSEPISDLSYFDCIESVMENSKVGLNVQQPEDQSALCSNRPDHWSPSCWFFVQVLGESMAGISQNCKTGDVPSFGDCVGSASKALCGLTEAAAQVQSGEAAVCMQVIVTNGCVFLFLRPPTWWVYRTPTVRLDTRGWWIPSSLAGPTRLSRWPVRT